MITFIPEQQHNPWSAGDRLWIKSGHRMRTYSFISRRGNGRKIEMPSPHEFMVAAPTLDDDKLIAMVRSTMLERLAGSRQLWLRELELALDGYGGQRNSAIADRIRAAIREVGESLGAG